MTDLQPIERRRRSQVVRHWFQDHPEWLVLVVSALGWVGLAWLLAGSFSLDHHHGSAAAATTSGSFDSHLLVWLVMVLAMMLPTTVPHLRYVGFNTRASHRQRSILLFGLGYLAVWVLPGFAVSLLPMPVSGILLVIVVLAGGGWELTAIKRRALQACCRTRPVRYTGAAADAAAVEYGLRHGSSCLLVSGPAMVALMLAGHPGWATVVLALVMAAQKLLADPLRWRTAVALGWLAAGLAVAGVAAFD